MSWACCNPPLGSCPGQPADGATQCIAARGVDWQGRQCIPGRCLLSRNHGLRHCKQHPPAKHPTPSPISGAPVPAAAETARFGRRKRHDGTDMWLSHMPPCSTHCSACQKTCLPCTSMKGVLLSLAPLVTHTCTATRTVTSFTIYMHHACV